MEPQLQWSFLFKGAMGFTSGWIALQPIQLMGKDNQSPSEGHKKVTGTVHKLVEKKQERDQ